MNERWDLVLNCPVLKAYNQMLILQSVEVFGFSTKHRISAHTFALTFGIMILHCPLFKSYQSAQDDVEKVVQLSVD